MMPPMNPGAPMGAPGGNPQTMMALQILSQILGNQEPDADDMALGSDDSDLPAAGAPDPAVVSGAPSDAAAGQQGAPPPAPGPMTQGAPPPGPPPATIQPSKGMGIKGPPISGHGIKGPAVHAVPKASHAQGPYKALGKSPKPIKPKPPTKGA